MPTIYTSQYTLQNAIGPTTENYTPIPHLNPLVVTDENLQFGGTALVTLFLGYVSSGQISSYNAYITIVDTSTNTTVAEAVYQGYYPVNTNVCISASYKIPANGKPKLVAQWKILGSTGWVAAPPTTISFSAIVFESED